MGMYDYIGDEQVKIFPVPLIYEGNIIYSGDSLSSFGQEDDLLLKNLYYPYLNDFLAFDFRWLDKEEFVYI